MVFVWYIIMYRRALYSFGAEGEGFGEAKQLFKNSKGAKFQ